MGENKVMESSCSCSSQTYEYTFINALTKDKKVMHCRCMKYCYHPPCMDELDMLIRQIFVVDDCQSVHFKSDEPLIFNMKVPAVAHGTNLAYMMSPGPRTVTFHLEYLSLIHI